MNLEISFSEIKIFLKKKINIKIGLNNKNRSQVVIDIPHLLLLIEIKEVKTNAVVLGYKAGSFLSKAKIWFFSSKVDEIIEKVNSPMLQFDKNKSEILIDLTNIDKLEEILSILSISEIYFVSNSIKIVLKIC